MLISEPGRKATEQAIRWGTHVIAPRETATRDRRKKIGASNKAGMPYQVYVTPGQPGEGEGGVLVLLHERWKHRVSTVRRDPVGRWLRLKLQTPVGPVTVIGYYGRPSPQHDPVTIAEWKTAQETIHTKYAKAQFTSNLQQGCNLLYAI
jgi:hypothetical protein